MVGPLSTTPCSSSIPAGSIYAQGILMRLTLHVQSPAPNRTIPSFSNDAAFASCQLWSNRDAVSNLRDMLTFTSHESRSKTYGVL